MDHNLWPNCAFDKKVKKRGMPPFFRAFLEGKTQHDGIKTEGKRAACDLCSYVGDSEIMLTSHILEMHISAWSWSGRNCIKYDFGDNGFSIVEYVFGKSYSLNFSQWESVFGEDIFLHGLSLELAIGLGEDNEFLGDWWENSLNVPSRDELMLQDSKRLQHPKPIRKFTI